MDFLLINNIIEDIERLLVTHNSNLEISKMIALKYPHAKKIFNVAVGLSIRQYVLKRRLSLIAEHIKESDDKITYIAYRYGMNMDTLSKAFTREFGVSPSNYRTSDDQIDLFDRFVPDEHPSYELTGFPVIFRGTFMLYTINRSLISYDHSVEEIRFLETDTFEKMGKRPNEYYGVATESTDDSDQFEYMICISADKNCLTDSSDVFECNHDTWALFRLIDNQTDLNDFFRYVTPFWSKNNSKYVIADHFVIECNFIDADGHNIKDVYIPVKSI